MRFLKKHELLPVFEDKRVAVVGSGPGVLDNAPGFVDSHDVVVRVNNYKVSDAAGRRTHVFYSFFGKSIKKTQDELVHEGVTLCMCKCPDAYAIDSEWHRARGMMIGVDFRPHYLRRAHWWFCDTYVPTTAEFLAKFQLLGNHVPTTGFAAILDVLSLRPASVYLTGFDFFRSRIHNVDEPWRVRHRTDPIGHRPEAEAQWLRENIARHPITTDAALAAALQVPAEAA